MKIKMTNLNYQFDEATGEIKSVEVRYQKYEGGNQFMTQVSIAESDLTEEQSFGSIRNNMALKLTILFVDSSASFGSIRNNMALKQRSTFAPGKTIQKSCTVNQNHLDYSSSSLTHS